MQTSTSCLRGQDVAFMFEWRASVQFVSEGRHDNVLVSEKDSPNLEKLSIINESRLIKGANSLLT